MDATISLVTGKTKYLDQLRSMYPVINFVEGSGFSYSYGISTITYPVDTNDTTEFLYSLLHEIGHAVLLHNNFSDDVELVNIERDAWEKSLDIGQKIGIDIDPEHIERCIDTYRDWLYARSLCPHCHQCGIQTACTAYSCPFCHNSWTVSESRLCKVSRRKASKK